MAFDITGQLNLRLSSGAVRNIATEINSGLRGLGATTLPVKTDLAAIRSVQNHVESTTTAMDKFAQQSGLAFKRFAAFSVSALPFIGLAKGIQDAATQAIEFDRQMVRLRQVTIEAGSEVGGVRQRVNELSTSFGVSSQDLIKTAVTLKQANLSLADTSDALEALAKSALAPNFDSMAQTTEGAIAVMSQFKISGKDLEAALGSMNAVAGEFAVEAGDLIEVVRRTGGAFKSSGGDLNELLALFTSVRQTTRESAESIATGLRTIFTRIQRNDTVKALREFGVELRYTREEAEKSGNLGLENQFVGAYEAIRRLSSALTQLPQQDPRYSAIIEDLGGYRQISKVIPLIQELSVSERALMVAEAGRVSLQVNAAQAADSYSNRLSKLGETYAFLGRSMVETASFKGAFSGFETLASTLAAVLSAAKPLLPILTAIAATRIGAGLFNAAANFQKGASYSGGSNLLGRASGGLVPGTGNTDSVPARLDSGSFVIKKSSVPNVLLTPGEYVVPPEQVQQIGIPRLNKLNSTGKIPGMSSGGVFDPSPQMAGGRYNKDGVYQGSGYAYPADQKFTEQDLAKHFQASLKKLGMEDLEKMLPESARKFEVDLDKKYHLKGGYRKDKKTININKTTTEEELTKMVGPHEIIHALDYAAGHKLGSLEKLSDYKKTKTGAALEELMPFVQQAVKTDKLTSKKEGYYENKAEILAQIFGHSMYTDFGTRLASTTEDKQAKAKIAELVGSIKKTFPEELRALKDVPESQEKINAGIATRNREPFRLKSPVDGLKEKQLNKGLDAFARKRQEIAKEASDRNMTQEAFASLPEIEPVVSSTNALEASFNKRLEEIKKQNVKAQPAPIASTVGGSATADISQVIRDQSGFQTNMSSAPKGLSKKQLLSQADARPQYGPAAALHGIYTSPYMAMQLSAKEQEAFRAKYDSEIKGDMPERAKKHDDLIRKKIQEQKIGAQIKPAAISMSDSEHRSMIMQSDSGDQVHLDSKYVQTFLDRYKDAKFHANAVDPSNNAAIVTSKGDRVGIMMPMSLPKVDVSKLPRDIPTLSSHMDKNFQRLRGSEDVVFGKERTEDRRKVIDVAVPNVANLKILQQGKDKSLYSVTREFTKGDKSTKTHKEEIAEGLSKDRAKDFASTILQYTSGSGEDNHLAFQMKQAGNESGALPPERKALQEPMPLSVLSNPTPPPPPQQSVSPQDSGVKPAQPARGKGKSKARAIPDTQEIKDKVKALADRKRILNEYRKKNPDYFDPPLEKAIADREAEIKRMRSDLGKKEKISGVTSGSALAAALQDPLAQRKDEINKNEWQPGDPTQERIQRMTAQIRQDGASPSAIIDAKIPRISLMSQEDRADRSATRRNEYRKKKQQEEATKEGKKVDEEPTGIALLRERNLQRKAEVASRLMHVAKPRPEGVHFGADYEAKLEGRESFVHSRADWIARARAKKAGYEFSPLPFSGESFDRIMADSLARQQAKKAGYEFSSWPLSDSSSAAAPGQLRTPLHTASPTDPTQGGKFDLGLPPNQTTHSTQQPSTASGQSTGNIVGSISKLISSLVALDKEILQKIKDFQALDVAIRQVTKTYNSGSSSTTTSLPNPQLPNLNSTHNTQNTQSTTNPTLPNLNSTQNTQSTTSPLPPNLGGVQPPVQPPVKTPPIPTLPPKGVRPYHSPDRISEFDPVIKDAMHSRGVISPYAATVGTYKGDAAARLLGDMSKVANGFTLISESIERTLMTTRPYLSAQNRRNQAEATALQITARASMANASEQRAVEARNIQKQATERSGNIDRMYELQKDARVLTKRYRDTKGGPNPDLEALAEAKRVKLELAAVQKQIAADEGLDPAWLAGATGKGRTSTRPSDRALFNQRQREYKKQYEAEGMIATNEESRAARIRSEFSGIEVSSKRDASGNTGLSFSGPADLINAGTQPSGIANTRRRSSLAKLLEDRISQKVRQIDPNNAGLDTATLARIKEEQKSLLQRQYVDRTALQIQQAMGIRDNDVATSMAVERFNIGLENDRRVKTTRSGEIIGDADLYRQGAKGGFRQRVVNMGRSIGSGLAGSFSPQTGFFGLQAIGGYTGSFSDTAAGSAEARVRAGDESTFSGFRGAGGLLSGAATGAAIGVSVGGAPGAAIGAVVGAAYGLANGLKTAASEIGEAKIGMALKATSDALTNFAKGTYSLNPFNIQTIRNDRGLLERETSNKAMRAASPMGFGVTFSEKTYLAELQKSMREINAVQAAPMMDALSKMIEEQAQLNVGSAAMKDRSARLQSFGQVLSADQGFGRGLLSRVASATQQDPVLLQERLFKSFERTQESEVIRRRQQSSETQVNRSAAMFSSLASAVESASIRLSRMSGSMKNLSDMMDSSVSSSIGTGLTETLQKPFAAPEEFMDSVRAITKMTGASGNVEAQAGVITATGRLLPSIINAVRSQPVADIARGADISIQIGDRLREALNAQGIDKAQSAIMVNSIQSQLGGEDFSKLLRETGQDMGKLIQKLLGPMAEPLKDSFTQIAKNLDERAKVFNDGLADLANRTRALGDLVDKASMARESAGRNATAIAVRRRDISEQDGDMLNLASSLRVQQERQSRLTGTFGAGAQDPDLIANKLRGTFGDIGRAEKRLENASRGDNIKEQNDAAIQLINLKTKAADLSQALKNLTDASERSAAAQEKLGKIQADREGRQALGIRYATANAEGRTEIARSFRLLTAAARMGTAAPFGIREQNQIFSLLSSLSPQMRLQGLGGTTVKELTNSLMTTTFGGAFDLDPQTAAMERALENFVQNNYETAARAAQLQVELQTNLQSEFFSRLTTSQDAFLAQLAKSMADNSRLLTESLRLQAASRVGDLEKQVGRSSMLGQIGIQTEPQFEAIKNTLKNGDQLQRIFAAGRNVSVFDQREKTAVSQSKDFAKVLSETVGGTSVRNLASGGAAATIMSQFAERGFTDAADQKKLLLILQEMVNESNLRGTIGNNTEGIAEMFSKAVKDLTWTRIAESRSEMSKAKGELERGGMIAPEIIEKIIDAANRAGGVITLSSLKDAVSAVDSTNRKFVELNMALEEAKKSLEAIGKPGGLAAGGAVRFFNKGGWGAGGSTTAHPADTVNARIAPDEFVVSSGPAQKHRSLLEQINRGEVPRFGEGGVVAQGLLNAHSEDYVNPKRIAELRQMSEWILMEEGAKTVFDAILAKPPTDRPKEIRSRLVESEKIGKPTPSQKGMNGALWSLNSVLNDEYLNEEAKSKVLVTYKDGLKWYYDKKIRWSIAQAMVTPGFESEPLLNEAIGEQYDYYGKLSESLKRVEGWEKDIGKNDINGLDWQIANGKTEGKYAWFRERLLSKRTREDRAFRDTFESLGPEMKPVVVGESVLPADIGEGRKFTRSNTEVELWNKKKKLEFDADRPTRDQVDEELKRKFYEKDLAAFFDKNWIPKQVARLTDGKPTSDEFAEDMLAGYRDQLGQKDKFKFDLDAAIVEKIKSTKKFEWFPSTEANAIKAGKDARADAFSSPTERIQNLLGGMKAENFGPKESASVSMAQLNAQHAQTFNRLSAGVQAKAVDEMKNRILGRKLNGGEMELLRLSGNLHVRKDFDDVSHSEIKRLLENMPKMAALERASAEIFVENLTKASSVGEKINKGAGDINSAEMSLFLAQLDIQGRKQALNQLTDPKNKIKFLRYQRFAQVNPEFVSKHLDESKANGAFSYATEANILEMLLGYRAKPASEVFRNADPKTLKGQLPGFAVGGMVPGTGNTDSVYAHLTPGSFVVRKSSVNSIGASKLASMDHYASGGVVPAMVMPGEYIFGPKQAAAIGHGRLDSMNKTGKLPRFQFGGAVGGAAGGFVQMPVPAPGMAWIQVPANQAQQQERKLNPLENAVQKVVNDRIVARDAAATNEARVARAKYNNDITLMRHKFFELRAKLLKSPSSMRNRDELAEYRSLYSALNNPEIIKEDIRQQQESIGDALKTLEGDPAKFFDEAQNLQKIVRDVKVDKLERRKALERLNQMRYAANTANALFGPGAAQKALGRVAAERRQQARDAAAAAAPAARAENNANRPRVEVDAPLAALKEEIFGEAIRKDKEREQEKRDPVNEHHRKLEENRKNTNAWDLDPARAAANKRHLEANQRNARTAEEKEKADAEAAKFAHMTEHKPERVPDSPAQKAAEEAERDARATRRHDRAVEEFVRPDYTASVKRIEEGLQGRGPNAEAIKNVRGYLPILGRNRMIKDALQNAGLVGRFPSDAEIKQMDDLAASGFNVTDVLGYKRLVQEGKAKEGGSFLFMAQAYDQMVNLKGFDVANSIKPGVGPAPNEDVLNRARYEAGRRAGYIQEEGLDDETKARIGRNFYGVISGRMKNAFDQSVESFRSGKKEEVIPEPPPRPRLRPRTPLGMASGGIVPGTGSHDSVPALLTPGELVVPKHQVQKFAAGGIVGGSAGGSSVDIMDAANRFNQAAAQIGQGLSGFSNSINSFSESVGTFGEFVARFDEAVAKIPEEITLSGTNDISVNIMGQDSIVRAVTEALGPMIAEAIRNSQPAEQRSS